MSIYVKQKYIFRPIRNKISNRASRKKFNPVRDFSAEFYYYVTFGIPITRDSGKCNAELDEKRATEGISNGANIKMAMV